MNLELVHLRNRAPEQSEAERLFGELQAIVDVLSDAAQSLKQEGEPELGMLQGLSDIMLDLTDPIERAVSALEGAGADTKLLSRLLTEFGQRRWDVNMALARVLPVDPDARILETPLQVRDWIASIDDRD